MKGKSLTQQLIHTLIAVIIAYTLTAIVPRVISTYLTTYFYLIVLVLCLLLVIVSRGASSINEYVVMIIPFLLWKVLLYLTTKPSLIDWAYQIVVDFTPIIVGLYIVRRLDIKSAKFFSVIIILAVVITSLTTYMGLIEDPSAARYLATVSDPNESKFVRYNMMNIGGYEFIYTTVLLYPVWIFAFKRGKIKKVYMAAIVIAELLLIIQSGYTTAFLLFLITSSFLFFSREFNEKYLILVGIIAIVLFFLLFDLLSQGLSALANVIENQEISSRLKDLSSGREGLEQSEDPRLKLYLTSLNTFINKPLLGSLGGGIGGHSFVFDTLATYGLLGAVIFIVLYTIIYKRFYLPYKNAKGYGFIVWMFVQTIILSTVNTGMWLYVLCLFIPVLLYFIVGKEKVKNSSVKKPSYQSQLRSIRDSE